MWVLLAGAVIATAPIDSVFQEWSKPRWQTTNVSKSILANDVPPTPFMDGYGVLMVAGGDYVNDALVSLAVVRRLNPSITIEVWHVGPAEIDSVRKQLDTLHVKTFDLQDYVNDTDLAVRQTNVGLKRFQVKPLALCTPHSNTFYCWTRTRLR